MRLTRKPVSPSVGKAASRQRKLRAPEAARNGHARAGGLELARDAHYDLPLGQAVPLQQDMSAEQRRNGKQTGPEDRVALTCVSLPLSSDSHMSDPQVVVGFPATSLLLVRARICISAAHSHEDLEYALEV